MRCCGNFSKDCEGMKKKIVKLIQEIGIRDIGFCPFSEVSGRLLTCRAAERIPQNAETVILMLFPYKVKQEPPEGISRYAAVPDYHRVCGSFLEQAAETLCRAFPGFHFQPFIDNSPIPEVYAASCAGLGVQGENGLLIHKRWGSWCFIGELVTDLKIPCEKAFQKCSLCGDCKKACPRGDHGTDCLSAVSQKKKPLSNEEIAALKENRLIWGCDICAEVCPLNRNAQTTYLKAFQNGYRNRYQIGESIAGRAYEWRGEQTVRRNAELFRSKKGR